MYKFVLYGVLFAISSFVPTRAHAADSGFPGFPVSSPALDQKKVEALRKSLDGDL